MTKFINKKTGLVETVTNEFLIEQYKKYTDVYTEVKDTPKEDSKPKDKPSKKK